MRRFLLSWLVNFLGLWVAATIFSGIAYQSRLLVLVVASLVFGIVNAVIRPLVIILSLPAIVVTLGVFTLVVNILMLYLTSVIYPPFQVNSIAAAVGTVIILWVLNYIFNDILIDKKETS